MEAKIQFKEENIFKLSIENCKLWNQIHILAEKNIRLYDNEDYSISLQHQLRALNVTIASLQPFNFELQSSLRTIRGTDSST